MAERNPFTHQFEHLPMAIGGGRKYGVTGSSTATSGPVDKAGYRERDRAAARRRALQTKLQAMGSPATLGVGTPIQTGR